MKTKSILIALFALSIIFSSCSKNDDITPSNNVTTIDKTITGYNQLVVSDPFKVFVTFSDTEENIQIEANSNLQQYITVKKQNNQLVVYIDDNIDIEGSAVLNIYITTKQLVSFYAEGASTIQLQNDLVTTNVSINLNGACTFNGTMLVNELVTDLTGASNLNISGSANSFELDATGASNMSDYGFETNSFSCDLEGASNAYLTIHQSLNVEANGSSNIYYKGDGVVISQELSGGSSIQKMN